MNRKGFIKTIVPAGLATMFSSRLHATPVTHSPDIASPLPFPPFLKTGDTIGITCPAGPLDSSSIQPCFRALKQWGLNYKLGKTVDKRWQRFGGTDKERTDDLQELLDDDSVNAILFGKGGYGTMRVIDDINWEKFKQKPKWLVGYSDLTVVHLHVFTNLKIPTIHADMCNGFRDQEVFDESTTSLEKALFGIKSEYNIWSTPMNRIGSARAPIIGGNLSLIVACLGSQSDINTDGCILFIEDVSEYKYTIDRMMTTLKRSGKLANLAGLLVGEFSATKEDVEEPFEMKIEEIIYEKVRAYNYPVCFHFPAGHIRENRALVMGVPYDFTVGREIVTLAETGGPSILGPLLDKLKPNPSVTEPVLIKNQKH